MFHGAEANTDLTVLVSSPSPTTHATWGTAGNSTAFTSGFTTAEATISLSGGVDDAPDSGDLQTAWSLFADAEQTDVNLLITGAMNTTDQKYVQDNMRRTKMMD